MPSPNHLISLATLALGASALTIPESNIVNDIAKTQDSGTPFHIGDLGIHVRTLTRRQTANQAATNQFTAVMAIDWQAESSFFNPTNTKQSKPLVCLKSSTPFTPGDGIEEFNEAFAALQDICAGGAVLKPGMTSIVADADVKVLLMAYNSGSSDVKCGQDLAEVSVGWETCSPDPSKPQLQSLWRVDDPAEGAGVKQPVFYFRVRSDLGEEEDDE